MAEQWKDMNEGWPEFPSSQQSAFQSKLSMERTKQLKEPGVEI